MLVVAVTFSDTLLIDTPVGPASRTIYRPVGKVVPVGRPVQTAGTYRAVALHIIARLGDKPSWVTLDCGQDHGGIRINKPGG